MNNMLSIRIFFPAIVWTLLSGFTFSVTEGTEISLQMGIVEFPQSRNIRVNPSCKSSNMDVGELLFYIFSLGLLCSEPETNEFVRQNVIYLERSTSLGLRHKFNDSYGILIKGGAAKLEPRNVTYDEPEDSSDFLLVEQIPAPEWEWVGGGVFRGICDVKWVTLEAGAHIQRFIGSWSALPSVRAAVRPVKGIEVYASAMDGVSLVSTGVATAGIRWQGRRFSLGFAEQVITHPRRFDSLVLAERFEVGARTEFIRVDVAGILGSNKTLGTQIQIGLQLD